MQSPDQTKQQSPGGILDLLPFLKRILGKVVKRSKFRRGVRDQQGRIWVECQAMWLYVHLFMSLPVFVGQRVRWGVRLHCCRHSVCVCFFPVYFRISKNTLQRVKYFFFLHCGYSHDTLHFYLFTIIFTFLKEHWNKSTILIKDI